MRARTHRRIALLVTALSLSACGQKGPLYLPDAAGEVVTRPTQTAAPDNPPPPAAEEPSQEPAKPRR